MFLLKRGTLLLLFSLSELPAVLVCLLSIALINTVTRCKLEKTLQFTAHHEGKSGQELRAGSWRQQLKRKHGEMPLLLSMVCSGCFLIQLRTTSLGWHHISIFSQENAPQTCLFSQLIFPLLR